MRRAIAIAFALGVALAGCGVEDIDDHPCPPGGTTLTYQNFGYGFFASHCIHCHGGPNGYSSRAFTTHASIRDDRARIFANSVGENPPMPPGPDDPSEDERRKLAEWLACGAP